MVSFFNKKEVTCHKTCFFGGPQGVVAGTSGIWGVLNCIPREIEELKKGLDLGEWGLCGIPKCNTCLMFKVQVFRFLSNSLYQCHTQRV